LRERALRGGWRGESGFRWRGGEVSRIEGLSDAVFGFAVTLLVVSLEVPTSFDQLLDTMRTFPAFGLSFALLILIWHSHYVFFRRYGLEDRFTVTLNAVLLFVVLFYVYPLKFLFTLVVQQVYGPGGASPGSIAIAPGQNVPLMIIYSSGFLAVFAVFAMLYVHAYRRRRDLDLDPVEVYDTLTSIQYHMIFVGVAASSILCAAVGGAAATPWSGLVYFVLGPALGVHGALRGRNRKALLAKSASEEA
jgi:uncharacterized membrane protein